MNSVQSYLITASLSLIPYLAVSWVFMALSGGKASDFWVAFALLIALRIFFGIIEWIGGILVWRLHGKREMVQRHLQLLRANNFPPREQTSRDFLSYLFQIEDDPTLPASLKMTAREMKFILVTYESIGVMPGMRMHAAADEALELYSPQDNARAV